jgi:hypothetical protein
VLGKGAANGVIGMSLGIYVYWTPACLFFFLVSALHPTQAVSHSQVLASIAGRGSEREKRAAWQHGCSISVQSGLCLTNIGDGEWKT